MIQQQKIFLQKLVWMFSFSLKLQSHWEFNYFNIMGLRDFRFIHLLPFGGRVGQEERSIELHHHSFKRSKQKSTTEKKSKTKKNPKTETS